MAKQTKKKAKPTKPRSGTMPGFVIKVAPPRQPSQEDFERAREHLGRRADALILDLANRYEAGKAAELTTVLDAIDSLSEIERRRPT
jgi:hypothetical protein